MLNRSLLLHPTIYKLQSFFETAPLPPALLPRVPFIFSVPVVLVVQLPSLVGLFVTHGLQHTRPLSLTISQSLPKFMFHPAISFSDALFSFCLQSFPASGTFLISCLFTSDDQNTRASALASGLPANIQVDFL